MAIFDDLGRVLVPFAFGDVPFPGEDVTTTFGHDSAQHRGYRSRGADIETTGPKPKTVRIRAVLVNGLRGWRGAPLFPDVYQRLVRALEANPEDFLSHPTRGVFSVHVDDVTEEVRGAQRRGVYLTLNLTEQRGEGDLQDSPTASARDPGADLRAAAAAVDASVPAGALPRPSFLATVQSSLDFLEADVRSYAEATAKLDALVADVRARLRDPAAALVDAHPFREALFAALSAIQSWREDAIGAAAPRIYVVTEEASVGRLAALPEVYGDAQRGAELLGANVILDPTRVPVGTRLLVVD